MEEQGETRKIQFTGKSSYIVSLPKQWIKELGLKQGDQIRMIRKGSSTLELYPPKFESRVQKKEDATIEIAEEEQPDSIVRKLISLYFLGFKIINIKSKSGRLNPIQRNTAKEAVKRMLMGSEIISDSSNGMTIQVMVNLLELSVDGAFKRMIHLAKSMLNDALLAVKENNLDLAQEVINTDDEVDRFGFRNARNCLGYRLIVKNIERTGDHAAFIAKDLLEFKKSIKKEILEKLQEMNDFSLTVLDESCLALFKEDYYQAEKTIKKIEQITKFEKKIKDASKSIKGDEEMYRVRRLAENIRRISEYASDIAEIVLNMNIEKTLTKTE
jgi:phosphate uptake regulator